MIAPATRAAVAMAGFACVGALAAGFVDPLPAWSRVIFALAGVVVVPALILRAPVLRVLGPGHGLLPLVLPVALLAVLSAHALLAGIFAFLGASFSLYAGCTIWGLLLYSAAELALAMRSRRQAANPPRRPFVTRRALLALAAAATLVAFAALVAPRYTGAEDAFDHIGHVRRVLVLNALQPDGVLALPLDAAAPMASDPRKGAFHDVVAVMTSLAGADPAVAWPLLRVVMFPLAVLAFAGLASVFVGGGALALCIGLFFLSYSGTAFRLVDASAYGMNLAVTWYWLIAALVLRNLTATRAQKAFLGLLCAGGVFVHLGVALHMAVFGLTLALFSSALGLGRRPALRTTLWILLAAAAAYLVRGAGDSVRPDANEIHAHLQGVMTVTKQWFVVSPMEILRQYGMVFLGGLCLLPVSVFAARGDARTRAALALAVIPVCVAFVPPLATFSFERASYMAFRSLLNAPVLPLAVLTLAWVAQRARARGTWRRLLPAALLVVWGVAFVAPALRAFGSDARRIAQPAGSAVLPNDLDIMVASFPVGATVLTDPVTAYRLSAFSSHRFVAVLEQHANPRDHYALERLAAVRDVLSPFALPQAAVEACRRFGVDFVVLSGAEWPVASHYLTVGAPALFRPAWDRLNSMPGSFREFARGDDFVVLRFDPDGVQANDWSGLPAPVVAAAGPPDACRVPVPGARFEIVGFTAAPAVVSPGDSIDVAFAYRRDGVSPFGPGILMHVRFDHERVPAQRRFPGEKYVRRARERAAGTLYRFRADLRAGHGVYEPDLWPMGTPLTERFRVAIPERLAPGVYRIEVKAVEETLLPVFDVTDLLYNRDHYSGARCATIDVGPRGVAR